MFKWGNRSTFRNCQKSLNHHDPRPLHIFKNFDIGATPQESASCLKCDVERIAALNFKDVPSNFCFGLQELLLSDNLSKVTAI